MKTYSILLTGLLLCNVQAHALTLTIDGSLGDWGINPANWLPADPRIQYKIEDQTGAASNYYLGPGWGGQAYDAEALYAVILSNRLYVALVTGHDPRTVHNPAANSFGAGDFFIDFGKNGSYELAVNVNHRLPSGFETGFVEGGVYRVTSHALGLFNEVDPDYPVSPAYRPTYLTAGTYLGMAQLAYTTSPVTGWGARPSDPHYIYEWSVGLDLLQAAGWDGRSAFNIHWTMNCANDTIWLTSPVPQRVPEPATLALLPLGLAGLLSLRRRTRPL
ncbi:MAG: PEP-CTERM sorting domain-containing protein [Burkholderiales bacterium]|nr:PEP-CTERM sorting domain-containing protein [Burkholderiales bacterium]